MDQISEKNAPKIIALEKDAYFAKVFIRNAGVLKKVSKKVRNRAHMTNDEEQAFLAPFFENARCSGVLVVGVIRNALEQHLGRKVALASAYNLLHRHGWRKLVPYKRHVQADIQAQEDWKKNSPAILRTSKKSGTGPALSG